MTPCFGDNQSHRLSVSTIWGVDDFLTPKLIRKKIRSRLSVSMLCRVGSSPYRWYTESATLRINDMRSWWLSVSMIRRVNFRSRISPSIQIRIWKNFMSSVRDLCRTEINIQKNRKKVSLVSSFKGLFVTVLNCNRLSLLVKKNRFFEVACQALGHGPADSCRGPCHPMGQRMFCV